MAAKLNLVQELIEGGSLNTEMLVSFKIPFDVYKKHSKTISQYKMKWNPELKTWSYMTKKPVACLSDFVCSVN